MSKKKFLVFILLLIFLPSNGSSFVDCLQLLKSYTTVSGQNGVNINCPSYLTFYPVGLYLLTILFTASQMTVAIASPIIFVLNVLPWFLISVFLSFALTNVLFWIFRKKDKEVTNPEVQSVSS